MLLYKTVGSEGRESRWEVVDPGTAVVREPPDPLTAAEEQALDKFIQDGTRGRRRGVRRADGAFVDLSEQIAVIEDRARMEEMRVLGFVDSDAVVEERVTGCYYVGVPDGEDGRILAALWTAMYDQNTGMVVKWSKRSKQALGVMVPRASGLTLFELAWREDTRARPDAAELVEFTGWLTGEEIDAAGQLVTAMLVHPSMLDEQRDDARVAREELLAAAREGALEGFVLPELPERRQASDDVAAELRGIAERARS